MEQKTRFEVLLYSEMWIENGVSSAGLGRRIQYVVSSVIANILRVLRALLQYT